MKNVIKSTSVKPIAEKTKATLCKEIGEMKNLSQSEMTSLERTSKEMLVKIQTWLTA
jgi:hypothetical protein